MVLKKAVVEAYPMDLAAARGIFDLLKNERVTTCPFLGKEGCTFNCQGCEVTLANIPQS
jgi:hypothetical protein